MSCGCEVERKRGRRNLKQRSRPLFDSELWPHPPLRSGARGECERVGAPRTLPPLGPCENDGPHSTSKLIAPPELVPCRPFEPINPRRKAPQLVSHTGAAADVLAATTTQSTIERTA